MQGIVSLADLELAWSKLDMKINNIDDATAFLMSSELEKDNTSRFFAWSLRLACLPDDCKLWPKTIYYNILGYYRRIKFYEQDRPGNQPIIDEETLGFIVSDVRRTIPLFHRFAAALGIPEEVLVDAQDHIVRVTAVTFRETPQYEYFQGCDRYSLISYGLALALAQRLGLSNTIAESMAAPLLRRLVALTDAGAYLETGSLAIEYFSRIDAFLRVHNSEMMDTVTSRGHSSATFTANWAGVMFAESHRPRDVLVIWDRFISHHGDDMLYLKATISAHLTQVPMRKNPFEQLEEIQSFDSWDIRRLLEDAETLWNSSPWGQPTVPKHALAGLAGWL